MTDPSRISPELVRLLERIGTRIDELAARRAADEDAGLVELASDDPAPDPATAPIGDLLHHLDRALTELDERQAFDAIAQTLVE